MEEKLVMRGKVTDKEKGGYYWATVKSQDTEYHKLGSKHIIHLSKGEKVSFCSFYVDGGMAHFGGMKVGRANRGNSISNANMEIFYRFADMLGLQAAETCNQNKPDLCAVLQQYGYAPLPGQTYFGAFMYPKDGDGNIPLYIPAFGCRRNFAATGAAKEGDYILLPEPLENATPALIKVGPQYAPHSQEMLGERRYRNSQRFDMQLGLLSID
jgi:hypothetical protein